VLSAFRAAADAAHQLAVASKGPPLPGVLSKLAPVLDHYGYLAVAALVCLEDFGVPAPGETVLVAASVYAGAHRLSIVVVGLVALVAAVVGDNIGFAIGTFGGHALVERYGRYVRLTPERFERAERWFSRRGGLVVIVARFVEGLRQANGIIAGTTEMPWHRFLVFNAIGATLWVATWTTIGYVAGEHVDRVYSIASRVTLAVVGLAIVGLLARFLIRRRRRARR